MAGASLLALLDDIATILDDVAVMTKVAAKKTAGVLGDDLALNAEQVSGVRAERELPVVWAVAGLAHEQGHPGANGTGDQRCRAFPGDAAADDRRPLSLLRRRREAGHKWLHRGDAEAEHQAELAAVADERVDLVAYEKEKIKGPSAPTSCFLPRSLSSRSALSPTSPSQRRRW